MQSQNTHIEDFTVSPDSEILGSDILGVGQQLHNIAAKPSAETERQYRDALGRFATGVTLVTADSADGPIGMTVNSFASVSLDPALVLWSVDKKSGRYEPFVTASHFAIHVLAENQHQAAMDFAREAQAFNAEDWHMSEDNVPLVKKAISRFECAREAVYDGGDHSIIVGRVLRFSQRQDQPLVFMAGEFGTFTARPAR